MSQQAIIFKNNNSIHNPNKNETLANTIDFIHENEIGEKHNILEKEIIIEVFKHEIK